MKYDTVENYVRAIAAFLNIPADDFVAFFNQDPYNGWDNGQTQWPGGSVYGDEGRILYALVRILRPSVVLEAGCFAGCSTTHIAAALATNQEGYVVSVDISPNAGRMIPNDLRPYIRSVNDDILNVLANSHPLIQDGVDLVFEDTEHTIITTAAILNAVKPHLKPNAVGVCHDSLHFRVGADVRAGMEQASVEAHHFMSPQAECGLGIWIHNKENVNGTP